MSLDYSKAFDTINHQLLREKFKFYGLSNRALSWIDSYLSNRTQKVVLSSGVESSTLHVDKGVPQGSNFGPTFYSVYSADLHNLNLLSLISSYADDTQLIFSFLVGDTPAAINIVNSDIDKVFDWSTDNALIINPDKSAFMIVDPTNKIPDKSLIHLTIDNTVIFPSETLKVLGVTLDSNWSFDKHVADKCGKTIGLLRALYPYRRIINTKLKLQITNSLIISILSYANIVYGPCLSTKTEYRVQRIQNSCIRFSFLLRKFDHISDALSASGWLNMRQIWTYQYVILIIKVLTTNNPAYLRECAVYLSDHYTRRSLITRSSALLSYPKYNKVTFRSSFSYLCPSLFNNLPNNLRRTTPNICYDSLKDHVRQTY